MANTDEYEKLMAAAPYRPTANATYRAVNVPSVYARYGYSTTPKLASAPTNSNPSGNAEKLANLFVTKDVNGNYRPGAVNRAIISGVKTLGGAVVSTVKSLGQAAKFSQENTITNPLFYTSRASDVYNSRRLSSEAESDISQANKQYSSGKIDKSQYDEAVNQAKSKLAQASEMSSEIIIQERPKTFEEYVNLIDGYMTAASLGSFAAAKIAGKTAFGAGYKALFNGKDMALSRIAMQEAAEAGAKNVNRVTFKVGAPEKLSASNKIANIIDRTIDSNPAWREAADRFAFKIGKSETANGFAKQALFQLAVTAPMRRENIRFVGDTITALKDGNWFMDDDKMGAIPSAILMSGMVVQGGPLGFVVKNMGKLGKTLKTAAYGEVTLVDEIGKALEKRNVQGNIIDGLSSYRKQAPKEIADDFKSNLQQIIGRNMTKGAAANVAEAIVNHYASKYGDDLSGTTAEAFWKDIFEHNYAQNALEGVNLTNKNGYIVAAKYSRETASGLSKRISQAINAKRKEIAELDDPLDRLAARKQAAVDVIMEEVSKNTIWAQNQDVVNGILRAIDKVQDTGRSGIKKILYAPNVVNAGKAAKGIPKDIKSQLARYGYIPVVTDNKYVTKQISKDVASNVSLKSKYVETGDELFEQAAQSKPFFSQIGTALTSAGLGLDESASVAYRIVRDGAAVGIDAVDGLAGDGRKILNALQEYTNVADNNRFADLTSLSRIKRRTVTDLRMLTKGEVRTALLEAGFDKKILTDNALNGIRRAIVEAHVSAPLKTMGVADAILARAYKYYPFHKIYARVQGALRYTYNPFFAVQEQAETELLGQALVPGKQPWLAGMGRLWSGTKEELDDVVKRMDDSGFFNNSALVNSNIDDSLMATRFGEGAQDVYLGRVSAVITDSQKRSLAAAVSKISDKMGLSVEDALRTKGAEIEDLVRPIVQYPSKGALNSNLAKMLNLAVFPSRYNIKIATLAAKSLSEAPPAVQLLTINKLWEMESWLRSPEGVAWYQQNQVAVDLLKWLTPIGSVQWVFDTLGAPFGKGHQGWGDLGVIGGLPFGVIGQILQSQGLYNLNTPYVNPADGEIFARRIPESMKARTASVLMDLLGSTFTYPGATIGLTRLGLPSKSEILRDAAGAVSLDTTGTEWRTEEYTPEDLPAFDRFRQDIWSQKYSVEEGPIYPREKLNSAPQLDLPPSLPEDSSISKQELNAIKQAYKK
jgi:hypothetical protein